MQSRHLFRHYNKMDPSCAIKRIPSANHHSPVVGPALAAAYNSDEKIHNNTHTTELVYHKTATILNVVSLIKLTLK